jgi:hypothetical protein
MAEVSAASEYAVLARSLRIHAPGSLALMRPAPFRPDRTGRVSWARPGLSFRSSQSRSWGPRFACPRIATPPRTSPPPRTAATNRAAATRRATHRTYVAWRPLRTRVGPGATADLRRSGAPRTSSYEWAAGACTGHGSASEAQDHQACRAGAAAYDQLEPIGIATGLVNGMAFVTMACVRCTNGFTNYCGEIRVTVARPPTWRRGGGTPDDRAR